MNPVECIEVTIDYKNFKIRKIIFKEKEYYYASDIGNACGIKKIRSTIKNFTKDEKIRASELNLKTYRMYDENPREDRSIILLTDRGVKKALISVRNKNAENVANILGINTYVRFTPIETETLSYIIKAFKNYKYQLQYIPPGTQYRVDLYFPDLKLAIECDEFNHADRKPEYETRRENEIKQTLNCEFIRYNPDCPNFNIFELINQIHQFIVNTCVKNH